MRFLPPRRWFQLRLSTWFVLVAILSWGMTCRPLLTLQVIETSQRIKSDGLGSRITEILTYGLTLNRQLRWPLGALTAFLAWKFARFVGGPDSRVSLATARCEFREGYLRFSVVVRCITLLALLGIVAWSMSVWPWCHQNATRIRATRQGPIGWTDASISGAMSIAKPSDKLRFWRQPDWQFNRRALGPATALSAILILGAAWATSARIVRRRPSAASE
jgi:hypothetical protein